MGVDDAKATATVICKDLPRALKISPDGSRVAYSLANEVVILEGATEICRIPSGLVDFSWSPRGGYLCGFERMRKEW